MSALTTWASRSSARWVGSKVSLAAASESTASSAATTTTMVVGNPLIPLKTATTLRHPLSTSRRRRSTTASAAALERVHDNVARLYARRCLELAAAAALTKRAVADLEDRIETPSTWDEGHDEFIRRKSDFGNSVGQLGDTRVARLWAAGSRLINLAVLASPFAVLTPATYLFPSNQYLNDSLWRYALWSVEKAGPTFIKLAQWASTRADLFSPDFCARFAKLQDSTRGHAWKDAHATLQKRFGENYDTDLLALSPTPIGSGCVAQVYKGTLLRGVGLHPAGETVAVKIQHPHISHKVCVDFYILQKVARFLERIPRLNLDYLSVQDSVDQFRGIMLPQLDLRCEARNLVRFARDFSGDDDVAFPRPLTDLTSETVLVESFVHGEPILRYLGAEHSVEDRRTLAQIGLRTAMRMIFLHDFVHGDLHPGNILVDRVADDGGGRLRMNILDCGLVVEMGERDHSNLVKILGALVKRDGMSAGRLMVDTAKKCQASATDVELFVRGIQNIILHDNENNFMEHVGDYLAEICHLACRHKVKLEASFINAALACEIMEGIACALYPEMKMQPIALPMVLKAEAMHAMRKFSFSGLVS